jgi:hypothetical protein
VLSFTTRHDWCYEVHRAFCGSSAAMNATSTSTEVSSALVKVASHLRETTSRTAIEARRARVQWVKS